MSYSRRDDSVTAPAGNGSTAFADWPLGMFSWFGYELAQEKRLDLIREAGFKVTSFWIARRWEEEHGVDYSRVVQVIRKSGLKIEFAHGDYRGCNAIWGKSPSARKAVWNDYTYYIDFCSTHRIPVVVFHLTRGPHPPRPGASGLSFISDLAAYAQQTGVRIAVENTRHREHLDAALEAVASPFLGLCYDSSHDFLYGSPAGEVLERWGRRLFATHFSDNDGEVDRHWLPSRENPLWDRVAAAFPRRSFAGAVHMEVLGYLQGSTPPGEFVAGAYSAARWLKKIFAGTGVDAGETNGSLPENPAGASSEPQSPV